MAPSTTDSQPPDVLNSRPEPGLGPGLGSPPEGPPKKKRVPSACQRCKQQKLKCDIQRPCTLCLRAGATCSAAVRPTVWKNHGPGQGPKPNRLNCGNAVELPAAKRPRHATSVENVPSPAASTTSPPPDSSTTPGNGIQNTRSTSRDRVLSPPRESSSSPWVSSSAAVQFMEEAFHQHNTTSPGGPETSALSAIHWTQGHDRVPLTGGISRISNNSSNGRPSEQREFNPRGSSHHVPRQHPRRDGPREVISPAEAELLSIIPSRPAATLLVQNYFDKVHWFMLVFHQSDFLESFRQLYEEIHERGQQQPTRVGLGFLSVFTAVCIVSLQYLDKDQQKHLCEGVTVANDLQKRLLNALRMRLLEVVSQGSIEAVQACVLLGSFYLYHGEPELAWPICGCGLRIAQALNLQRRRPQLEDTSGPPDLDDPGQRAEEARKRCWWAVYEIETTCSMLYGFPLSINDNDCDIQPLNPYSLRSNDASWDATARKEMGQATLLSHKHAMSQLSVIVKSALTDLYGLCRSRMQINGNSGAANRNRLEELMASVTSLDKRLREWHARLPLQLRPASLTNATTAPVEISPRIGGGVVLSDKAFENHLFQLQALSLKVAYENAKILIHRPLLSYRMVVPPTKAATTTIPGTSDTCQSSIQVFRDATLEISNIGSLPVFQGIADTYAVSFVSLHLLTAAIALSILTTLNPLTQESHDCKMGIRRLMEMQSRLSARSIVAEQGLGILKKLMSLVLTKEMKEMLDFSCPKDDTTETEPPNDVRDVDNNPNRPSQGGQQVQVSIGEQRETCQSTSHLGDQLADSITVDANSTPTLTDSAGANASPEFNFYGDPTITQALLDFEQAVSYIPDEPARGTVSLGEAEYSTGSCFSIQDQSWIWGSSH